ncbi:response regulator [Kitasatospora sp. NPDC002227]|uniref:response regulator n=1 Tax=Kitasatospora sp. NPDC002227 TaxID=3154773 RepID=UPI00331860EC
MIDVLVVDDDFYVARINAHYVSQVPGFRVAGVAHSAAGVLAAVERGGIDLILLDQHLPGGSGCALTRQLREQGRDLDVIMVTADRRPASVREARRAGVLQYLLKPFGLPELRDKLAAYARLRRALAGPELGQAELDRVFGAPGGAPEADGQPQLPKAQLPKGFTERTVELIRRIVDRAQGPVTAQEVSEQAGISRSTAQRYLKFLERTRLVSLTLRYGSSGRPEHLYSGV